MGQILPLHVSTSTLNNGDADSSDAYTFFVHTPDLSGRKISQEVRRSKVHGFEIAYSAQRVSDDTSMTFTVTAAEENIIVLIRTTELFPSSDS